MLKAIVFVFCEFVLIFCEVIGVAESCMARVLHLLPSTALRLSIQDTETLLANLRQPIDQLNYANADTASLSALLGGRQNADMLVRCLSKSTDLIYYTHTVFF